jgi:hypothetical protein
MDEQTGPDKRSRLRQAHRSRIEGSGEALRRSRALLEEQRLVRLLPSVVVARELDPADPRVHAMTDLGATTPRYGIALCGVPSDHLAIVPDLDWAEVEEASRCVHCQEDLLLLTRP